MGPWIQPTTAPHQPDLADKDESVAEDAPLVERGWMETSPAPEAFPVTQSDSFAITAFTAAVVVVYVFFAAVAGPILLSVLL